MNGITNTTWDNREISHGTGFNMQGLCDRIGTAISGDDIIVKIKIAPHKTWCKYVLLVGIRSGCTVDGQIPPVGG